jgi:hypothetical protein
MSAIQDQVKLLEFRFKGIEQQTDGFSFDYISASDEDVFNLTPIAQDTIDGLSQLIMKMILPAQRAKLRKQIAYIIGLRAKQQEVWSRKIEEFSQRTKNTNEWVILNSHKQ